MLVKTHLRFIPIFTAIFLCIGIAQAQSTEITYQGRLLNGTSPANGSHDFEFSLYDGITGGSQIGSTVSLTAVNVNNGVFSVRIDFGNQFPGANRYLEIRVKESGGTEFTTLTPRQAISSAPYAIKSLNAENAVTANSADSATSASTAANSLRLSGVDGRLYVVTGDARLSDARTPLPNSTFYIQNTTAQQASNFNITGNGTVGGSLNASSVLTGNGSAQNPSLSFANDSDTGIFRSAADSLNLSTNGISRLQIDPDGNIGIGTTPLAVGRLRVISPNGAQAAINGENTSTGLGTSYGVIGRSASNPGFGYGGRFEGGFVGVYAFGIGGDSSGPAYGLAGLVSGTAGTRYAVHASANVGNGTQTAYGIYATATGAATNWAGYFQGNVHVQGTSSISTLGSGGSSQLCRNGSQQISSCSSSIRYKQNVTPFGSGISLVRKLRPVSFNWKDGGMPDMGLVAEEVAAVEPLLTTTNDNGEVEGVKYDRVGVVLINAVNEQQAQIENQQKRIDSQQKQIEEQKAIIRREQAGFDALKKLVCSQNPAAALCRPNN
jgi:hypothetical protein